MKAFVVFIDTNNDSISHAMQVMRSLRDFDSWNPELLLGVTPNSLALFEDRYPLRFQPKSRVRLLRKANYRTYKSKKSCFYNHYRTWLHSVEINEPVAFIEHDSLCMQDWDNPDFADILVLNARSALSQSQVQKNFRKNGFEDKYTVEDGVHPWKYPLLNHHTEDSAWPTMMPGTAAYAVTPQGARKLLEHARTYGWEQSDHFINTSVVDIQYRSPEYFNLGLENLRLSHGS